MVDTSDRTPTAIATPAELGRDHDHRARRHGNHRSRDIGAVTGDRRRVAADVLVIVGGARARAVGVHALGVDAAYGSGLRGHALIDAIVAAGRHFPGLSVARLTVLWYLVPALGAASWIATGLRGAGQPRDARRRGARRASPRCCRSLAIVRLVGFDHLGLGAWVALAGAAALVVGSWIVAPRRARLGPIGQNGRPGPVAQWSEQGTHNPSVEGSIPSRPTMKAQVDARVTTRPSRTGREEGAIGSMATCRRSRLRVRS